MIYLGLLSYQNPFNPKASRNIGDYIQSLAALNIYYKYICQQNPDYNDDFETFLKQMVKNQVPNYKFVWIRRDRMNHSKNQYNSDQKIVLIMNAWWMHPYNSADEIDFKIPDYIIPIFVSFHIANKKLLEPSYIDELKKYQPIGCRDQSTTKKLLKSGVDAYFSGCLTTTIDFLKWKLPVKPKDQKVFCVDTKLQNHIHIKIKHEPEEYRNIPPNQGLLEAYKYLKNYANCKRIYTSRLHGYLPCLAMGVPVEFISPAGSKNSKTWGSKGRFEGLRELGKNPKKLKKLQTTLTENTLNQLTNVMKKDTNNS